MKVVYCGGCNPEIDRAALARELAARPALSGRDVTVYLAGCQRSCAAGQALKLDDPAAVVVAGRYLDGRPVDPVKLAAEIEALILRKL